MPHDVPPIQCPEPGRGHERRTLRVLLGRRAAAGLARGSGGLLGDPHARATSLWASVVAHPTHQEKTAYRPRTKRFGYRSANRDLGDATRGWGNVKNKVGGDLQRTTLGSRGLVLYRHPSLPHPAVAPARGKRC